MGVLFVGREITGPQLAPADFAHHQHVGIVVVAQARKRLPDGVVVEDVHQALGEVLAGTVADVPQIADVRRWSASNWPAGAYSCRVDVERGVRQAVDDVAAARPQGVRHVGNVRNIRGAPVVLEVIDAPGGPLPGVVGGE